MLSWIGDQVIRLLGAPALVVFAVTFAVVFVEDALFVGFVVPGESVAVLSGVAAHLGHVRLPVMIAGVAVAAVLGDATGFEIGRRLGPRLLAVRPMARHERRVRAASTVIQRRGGPAVFIGRWTAFLRAVTPALAGAGRMPARVFVPWNVAGGLAWSIACVGGGYLAGGSYTRLESWVGRAGAIAFSLGVVSALAGWHLRRRRTPDGGLS